MQGSLVIIGGGIVGAAVAYTLAEKKLHHITLIERNDSPIGRNQSTRNGGVIHSGLYYPSDIEPLKAELCVEGNARMYEFCTKYSLPHRKCGKLIIARNTDEEEMLSFFMSIGKENGVPDLRMLTTKEAQTLEPNLSGISAALFVPSCGIAALSPLLSVLYARLEALGVSLLLGTHVDSIASRSDSFELTLTQRGKPVELLADHIINAAGLYSDEIARMINPAQRYEMVPARGELFCYNDSTRQDISLGGHHIYPPPFLYDTVSGNRLTAKAADIRPLLKQKNVTKTLGVHLTPTFDKTSTGYAERHTVVVGPLKSFGTGKEDYDTHQKTAHDYIAAVGSFFPNLKPEDLSPRYTGIMAVLKGTTDFVIERDPLYPNCLNLIGMDSPAWTAAFAIGRHVTTIL